MTQKHTPGPWAQIPQNGAGPMIAHEYETGNQMNPTGLRLICHMLQRGNSLDQDQANAALIARAPDLLADNERLRACLDGIPESMLTGPGCVAPAITVTNLMAECDRLRQINAELVAALEELESHCYAGALELAESHPAINKARAALAKAKELEMAAMERCYNAMGLVTKEKP